MYNTPAAAAATATLKNIMANDREKKEVRNQQSLAIIVLLLSARKFNSCE